jgi:hypothetical protein
MSRQIFAEATVDIDPFRITADVTADGSVNLPHSLRDERFRHEIRVAIRRAALQELIKHMKGRNECEEIELQRRLEMQRGARS